MPDKRLNELRNWLKTIFDEPVLKLTPASSDASFRRYFRAQLASGSYVVMDAPPAKEPLDAFIRIDVALIKQAVHAPKILNQNTQDGFLLLEDLGDSTYLDELKNSANMLYSDAIGALLKIQLGTYEQADFSLPVYDQLLLEQELDLFTSWYLKYHLQRQLTSSQQLIWQKTKDFLIQQCLEQPQVWVHRDYHSRNLMLSNSNSPAVIDFQDMVLGPIAYDLASLFKDCYIKWPRQRQRKWLMEYQDKARNELPNVDYTIDQLIRWVDLTGLQRHLKVLGVFSRLHYRDGKSHYRRDLPLVKTYIEETLERYPELAEFSTVFVNTHTTTK